MAEANAWKMYDSRRPRPTDICTDCGVTRQENRRSPSPCTSPNDFGLQQRFYHHWNRAPAPREGENRQEEPRG